MTSIAADPNSKIPGHFYLRAPSLGNPAAARVLLNGAALAAGLPGVTAFGGSGLYTVHFAQPAQDSAASAVAILGHKQGEIDASGRAQWQGNRWTWTDATIAQLAALIASTFQRPSTDVVQSWAEAQVLIASSKDAASTPAAKLAAALAARRPQFSWKGALLVALGVLAGIGVSRRRGRK